MLLSCFDFIYRLSGDAIIHKEDKTEDKTVDQTA